MANARHIKRDFSQKGQYKSPGLKTFMYASLVRALPGMGGDYCPVADSLSDSGLLTNFNGWQTHYNRPGDLPFYSDVLFPRKVYHVSTQHGWEFHIRSSHHREKSHHCTRFGSRIRATVTKIQYGPVSVEPSHLRK